MSRFSAVGAIVGLMHGIRGSRSATDRFKHCPTCCDVGQALPAAAFYRNAGRRGGLSSQCRSCHGAVERRYYQRNLERERARRRARGPLQRQANRAQMVEFLATQACVDCGVDNPIVLEFHHVRSKGHGDADASVLVTHGYGWARVQAEMDKCIVLCANRHRIRTASDRGHYRARHSLPRGERSGVEG
jgi:hypothetical protein